MKLSISNIAWNANDDEFMYSIIKDSAFSAVEVAPTRIFPVNPYDNLESARKWSENLEKKYNLKISSMQSIWFGRNEKIFGSANERKALIDYTFRAIDFAKSVKCENLVFGCPKNRYLPDGVSENLSIDFFKTIGAYAASNGISINMEANPPIYNTNYINTTQSAFELVKEVNSKGFNINLDLGTMIENREPIQILENNYKYIKHIHISEPKLKTVEKRCIHRELAEFLASIDYTGYVSIEMGIQSDISVIRSVMEYVEDVFYDI